MSGRFRMMVVIFSIIHTYMEENDSVVKIVLIIYKCNHGDIFTILI